MSFLDTYESTPDADKARMLFGGLSKDVLAVTAELRAHRPILAAPGGVALITRFHDVQEVLSRNLVFTVRPYQPKMDPCVGPYMLARDGTVYNQRDKGIMRALIQQADMSGVRTTVARLAREAVARGASDDGRLELVSQVTRLVPVRLTGSYFGFPGPDDAMMMEWSRATQHDMFRNPTNDPGIHARNVAAGAQMKEYLSTFLADRARQLKYEAEAEDIVSRMLRLVLPASIGFDFERIMANTMGLLVGGVETTSAAVVQALDQLLDRPQQLAEAQAAAKSDDTASFDRYFWEALRFNPMNPFVARLAVADYVIAAGTARETPIPAGTLVLASNASAMHDENEIPQPQDFRAGRPDYHYMHFGFGNHRCLGDQVSLQQAPAIAREILLAGFTARAEGAAGRIDMRGGPFPESLTLTKA
ncbi:MAG: cytochrome P450 [Acetobacterales bacterium]